MKKLTRLLRKRLRRGAKWLAIVALACLILSLIPVVIFRFVGPPLNAYQASEWVRLGDIRKDWISLDVLPAHIPLSAAAAEDARFCGHWGFDLAAIRAALADGASRGASTISQQTAKNVFLWQGRSWLRKGLEAGFTLLIEAVWPKRRIMEVYLNVAEFDTGVFGIEAAAWHHFGIPASQLSRQQTARLMAVLPDPKGRSAVAPSPGLQRRAQSIAAGARTLAGDGRGTCVTP